MYLCAYVTKQYNLVPAKQLHLIMDQTIRLTGYNGLSSNRLSD